MKETIINKELRNIIGDKARETIIKHATIENMANKFAVAIRKVLL